MYSNLFFLVSSPKIKWQWPSLKFSLNVNTYRKNVAANFPISAKTSEKKTRSFFKNLLRFGSIYHDMTQIQSLLKYFLKKCYQSHLLMLSSLKLEPPQLRNFLKTNCSIQKRLTFRCTKRGKFDHSCDKAHKTAKKF